MAMTTSRAKIRIRRRGALLLILAGVATVAPVTGRHGIMAFADDGGDGGSNSGSGGGDDGGGDDGGGDDGGGDDGGGDDGGGGGSGGGGSGGGGSGGGDDDDDDDDGGGSGNSGSSRSGKGGSGTPSGKSSTSQRDGALARQLKGRIASISEVEAIASKAVPGEIIDVKLYRSKDRYLYRVKIIQRTGSIYDVRVDAVSRKVLSARER